LNFLTAANGAATLGGGFLHSGFVRQRKRLAGFRGRR
jgi:hypothetical protein